MSDPFQGSQGSSSREGKAVPTNCTHEQWLPGSPLQQSCRVTLIMTSLSYLHSRLVKADSKPCIVTKTPRSCFIVAHGDPARCQQKWDCLKAKVRAALLEVRGEYQEEAKSPLKLLESHGWLHCLSWQNPEASQFTYIFQVTGRSRGVFRLFFAMAHELQSFYRNLFLLYCFLREEQNELEKTMKAWSQCFVAEV